MKSDWNTHMTAKSLSELFLAKWQAENPEGRIYRNNTGVAFFQNKDGSLRPVAFGIPAPKLGKKKKNRAKGGGGTDYISFSPMCILTKTTAVGPTIGGTGGIESIKTYIIAEFWEIKTLNDVISEDQKRFYRVITGMGGTINIVQETPEGWEIVEWKE